MLDLVHGNYDWILRIVFGLVLVWAWLKFFSKEPWNKVSFWLLIRFSIAVRVAYALAQSIGQYVIWNKSDLTRIFNSVPGPDIFGFKGGYFLFYVLNRFWGNMVLGILVAWLFYKALLLLKKYKDRFLSREEAELGFLIVLVLAWPDLVIFVPLFALFVVFISLIRQIFWKERYTTLGLPMLLAISLIWLFEPYLEGLFGLGVLKL